ncbi:MAG TPA: type IV pilus biogenesis/stability protein PilW [Gammaproteobacteria bacterium]|jgi:type IV pilus assembly protein PilF|nr:type IV pilus biogenesis/stability protein PilW [Gammaproteobacteria bacterium]
MNKLMRWSGVVVAAMLAGCVSSGSTFAGDKVSMKQASDYNTQLGVAYLQQGNRDLAMQKLQKALEQNPDNANAYLGLGLLYDSIGDTNKAENSYEKALDKAPDDPDVQNNYAVFLCQHGQQKKSEKYFLEAAQNALYATPDAAYTNAGVCASQIPDMKTAEQYFRKALDINPIFPSALYQMAQISYQQKKYLQARAFIERFNSASKQPRPEVLLLGVLTERALGNEQNAADYAKKLRTLFPDSPQAQQINHSP